MRDVPAFPRWTLPLALIVGGLRLVNVTSFVVVIPNIVMLIGGLAFIAWFVGANVGLSRLGQQKRNLMPATT